MTYKGLTRSESVFINRMMEDYNKDDMPTGDRVRFDMIRMATMVVRLDAELKKAVSDE